MNNFYKFKKIIATIIIATFIINTASCVAINDKVLQSTTIVDEIEKTENADLIIQPAEETIEIQETNNSSVDDREVIEDSSNNKSSTIYTTRKIYLDFTAPYATYSIINDGYAVLYQLKKNKVSNYKNKIVAVNAGHGTKGGATIKTFAHPDFSPKVTGGSNAAGAILSAAVSAGMTFENGMTEANANLVVAYLLKDKLLDNGYSVLMIRENDDCRLDNIARTVIANGNADAHVSIHFDSTTNDKGIFYIVPYNDPNYLNMEPLKSNAKNIKALGDSIIKAYRDMGEKIWKDRGTLQGDLTQLSFSTNASVDIELGDRKTEVTKEKAEIFAEGLARGIDNYFNP